MKIGKIFVLLGALLTLVSTFFLSFGQTNGSVGRTYISGIGFLFNLPEIIGDVNIYVGYMSGEVMVIYIVSIVLLVFLLAGIIQLIGLINRAVALTGSLLALSVGIVVILAILIDIPGWGLNQYSSLLWRAPIVDGIWPLDVPLMAASSAFYNTLSLGSITLVAGGGLGLVGGILGVKD